MITSDQISCIIDLLAIVGVIWLYIYYKFFMCKKSSKKNNTSKVKKKNMFVSIDGNIGSGKSTLVSVLKDHYKNNDRIVFVDEPIDEWCNITDDDDKNILDYFYKDKKRWSYTFQNFAFITRISKLLTLDDLNSNKIIISERSPQTDRYVFAKMLYETDYLTEVEYGMYLYWYNFYMTRYKSSIDNIIYLKSSPSVSYERIKKRNRDEETIIDKGYIESVHDYHEHWLQKDNFNVCEIKGDIEFENNDVMKQKIINKIDSFIYRLR